MVATTAQIIAESALDAALLSGGRRSGLALKTGAGRAVAMSRAASRMACYCRFAVVTVLFRDLHAQKHAFAQ